MFKHMGLALLPLLLICGAAVAQEPDYFAEIGLKSQNNRIKLLKQKKPPVLPRIDLPFKKGKTFAFKQVQEISTKKELYGELEKLKAQFLPYMQDVAPALASKRERIDLTTFKWRLQDSLHVLDDFTKAKQGNGNWEAVTIPHFGPPYGKATAYYYKRLRIPEKMLAGKALFLHFKGVDYAADVFVNGAYVGSHEGFFAPFEFDITKFAKGGENDLLVRVKNDYTTTGFLAAGKERIYGDKIYAVTGLGYDNFFDGGHQCAPGMGIYQDCYLEARDPIHVNNVFVRPLFDESSAELRLEIANASSKRQPVSFVFSVYGQNFSQTVVKDSLIVPAAVHVPGVGDLEKPTDWKQTAMPLGSGVNYFTFNFTLPQFRSWSNDHPWLYQVQIKVLNEKNEVTDTYRQSFGMRSFKMDTLSFPKGRLYFNNEKIRLRGANTMGAFQQDVAKKDWAQLIDDLLLAKLTNMNFIRLTQRPVQPEIYEYADKLGVMLQTDFPTFGGIRYNKWEECVRQASEMERLVRNHPSNILITYINERFPNAEGHPQRNMAAAEDYFALFRAMDEAILKENPDRVIKPADGDYDPPSPGLPDSHCYNTWYNGHGLGVGELYKGYWQWIKPGWYYACGEFGAEALDPIEVMVKYYPRQWLPQTPEENKTWTANRIYAAQTQKFHYMWYNTQHSLKDWVEASQNHQVWALETVTEAFRRDSNMVSFAVHLFIDAWPAGWMKTIMDVDRNPKKAFFTYRNALKPTIVTTRSDRKHFYSGENIRIEAWVSHDPPFKPEGYTLRYQLEEGGQVLQSGQSGVDVPPNSVQFQGYVPFAAPAVKTRKTYVLRTAIFNEKGESVDQTTMEIDVFAAPFKTGAKKTIAYLGEGDGTTDYLKQNVHLRTAAQWQDADIIWVADFSQYEQHKEMLDRLVTAGRRLVLYQVPVGDHQIGNTKVVVQKTAMGSYYFASPATGHRFTKAAKPFDFKMWFDEEKGFITPFLDKIVLAGSEWKPVLASGNTNWVEDSGSAMAAGELSLGEGAIFINQMDVKDRLKTNPVAQNFVENLLLY